MYSDWFPITPRRTLESSPEDGCERLALSHWWAYEHITTVKLSDLFVSTGAGLWSQPPSVNQNSLTCGCTTFWSFEFCLQRLNEMF